MRVIYSYPAGFVYVFSLLYWLTSAGANIRLAQYMFAIIYLITIILVFNIYRRVRKVYRSLCHLSQDFVLEDKTEGLAVK